MICECLGFVECDIRTDFLFLALRAKSQTVTVLRVMLYFNHEPGVLINVSIVLSNVI